MGGKGGPAPLKFKLGPTQFSSSPISARIMNIGVIFYPMVKQVTPFDFHTLTLQRSGEGRSMSFIVSYSIENHAHY